MYIISESEYASLLGFICGNTYTWRHQWYPDLKISHLFLVGQTKSSTILWRKKAVGSLRLEDLAQQLGFEPGWNLWFDASYACFVVSCYMLYIYIYIYTYHINDYDHLPSIQSHTPKMFFFPEKVSRQSPGCWIIYPVNGSPVIQLADMQNTAGWRSFMDRLGPGRNLDFVSCWIVSHKRFI